MDLMTTLFGPYDNQIFIYQVMPCILAKYCSEGGGRLSLTFKFLDILETRVYHRRTCSRLDNDTNEPEIAAEASDSTPE